MGLKPYKRFSIVIYIHGLWVDTYVIIKWKEAGAMPILWWDIIPGEKYRKKMLWASKYNYRWL